jgi:putative sigma-54 modulation protein
MNLKYRSHNTTIGDDLRDYAERKIERLQRLLPRLDDVTIEVEQQETRSAGARYRVQVTVHAAGAMLRGDQRGGDARSALDLAIDVVDRQARKHQKRLIDRHHKITAKDMVAGGEAPGVTPASSGNGGASRDGDEDYSEYVLGKVVRVKQFEAKPMSEEEALAQMDLLGHDFFLFCDARTNEYALLYKRRDGDYGLLTPRRG